MCCAPLLGRACLGDTCILPAVSFRDTFHCLQDIAELRMKTVAEIEMKKLKYMEKHAKYTRKVAECRRDLAEAKTKLEAYQASKAAPATAR